MTQRWTALEDTRMLAYSESSAPRSIQVPDLPTPYNPRDPAHAVQVMLRGTHKPQRARAA
jgi:hypothetical protein